MRVRGFEEEQVESVSAPTINNNTARAASSIVPLKKWEFWVIDISRAYLQSKDSWRKIYMLPPVGAIGNQSKTVGKRTIWRIVKPIYGLCDATKGWYETLKEFLTKECGAVASEVDPAMFYWTGHGTNGVYKKTWSKTWEDVENSRLPPEVIDEIPDAQVFGVMTCHVDDLTLYGNRGFLE